MSRYAEDENKYGGDREPASAQTPLPVVYPSARGGGGGGVGGSGNPLRLSIPSTPAQASFAGTVAAAPANVRTSNSSLPPTRVASPRQTAVDQSASFQPAGFAPVAAAGSNSSQPGPTPAPLLLSSPSPAPSASPTASALAAQRTRVPMPGPGGRSALGHRHGTGTGGLAQGGGGGGGLSKLTACFRPAPHPSVIFDLQLSSLVAAYNRLPSFLDASIALLEACLSDGSVRADQLFQSAGPDRVPESALQELVNYLEEAGEAGATVQSLSFYGCQAVSAFLLRFLDNIPEPLLTYAKYDQFLRAANMDPHAVGPGSNAGFRAAFPACVDLAARTGAGARSGAAAAAALDADDQMLVMQSLLISLPGAHYMLLQRMLHLFRRMLDAAAAASPRARGQHHFHQAYPSPATGLSSPTSVSLQRLSLLFCSTFLSPLHLPGYNAAASLDAALRKAQEQQVLVYLVQHYDDLFHRHPVRLLHAQPPPVAPVVHDPNEKLLRAVELWRNKSHQIRINFGRRHFDIKAIMRAFRAWKGLSKTNRRRAEAYRQLALLKQELLAEKHKNALLSKELYGLKEEFELRDFADQLRVQSAQVGRGGYGISGATARLNLGPAATSAVPLAAAAPMSSTMGAGALPSSSPAKPAYTVGGSALRGASRTTSPTSYEEKEQAVSAALVRDLRVDSSSLLMHGAALTAAAGPGARDLTADLAAVRALQEQDRRLTNTYARVNSRG